MTFKLKHLARLQYGDALATDARQNGDFIVYGSNGPVGYHNRANTLAPAVIVGRKGSFGKVTWANNGGFCIDTAYFIDKRHIRGEIRFIFYLLQSLALDTLSKDSAVPGLDRADALNREIPQVDLDTQKPIVAYLDRETARIDQLISQKDRQIELLRSRAKQAVAELVTGAGKEDVATFSTGLDHIPRIPGHWVLVRAGQLFREVSEPNSDDLPVLSVSIHSGISDRQLDDDERDRKVSLIEDRSSYQRVRPGYLAYNMMRAWQGAVGVSTVEGAVSPAYVVAKPTRALHSPYYQFLLRTPPFIEQMRQGSKGITDFRLRLYWHQFRLIMLPVPPLDEQRQIANEAERELKHADAMTEKVNRSVELLRERRAALITAAVTGQLDIREKPPAITTKPDRAKFRVIVGAEIIYRHPNNPKRGRVKLQKMLYLAEAHLGIDGLQGNYLREAAGPLDRALIDETERGLEAADYHRASQPDGTGTAVTYAPLAKAGQHKAELAALLGPKAEALRSLIATLAELDRRAIEAVATLYAVWNDALMDGATPDDSTIIHGVLNEWHAEKGEKFNSVDLTHWLGWMKRHKLVPRGQGPRTKPTMMRRLL